MAKDPAFLFYYQDFAYGTRKMSFEEKGCYIELLCEQADTGHLSLDDIKRALNSHFPIWNAICCKFSTDDKGLFYNKVLDDHIFKRQKYVKSRQNNLKGSHMDTHMVEHMENVNVNEIKDVNNKQQPSITTNIFNKVKKSNMTNVYDFQAIWAKYPNRDGGKEAERHFKASVKTAKDYADIQIALENYMQSEKVSKGYIKNGSTWFNNWRDWIDYEEPSGDSKELRETKRSVRSDQHT